MRIFSKVGWSIFLVAWFWTSASGVVAQVPLYFANEETTVRKLAFRFNDTQTFEDDLLRAQIATQAPGFLDQVKKVAPFVSPKVYPLDRIELQKDVVRLRRFYQDRGFLNPVIDYGTSRLDTTNNTLYVRFTITEGPPIIIQDVGFYSPTGGYATDLFQGEERERWIRFRDRTSFKTGDRYTDVDLIRIQDQVLGWLKDRGYAFARFDTTLLEIDSTYYTADISFYLNPGPRGYFDRIEIDGNEQITNSVARRELPFKKGDRFSYSKLIDGQRELFGLNLFRVVLADVPPAALDPANIQPGEQLRDSTVNVRFRVSESRLRYVSAQTGYAPEGGIHARGQWLHRNFAGGGRNLSVGLTVESGYLAAGSDETSAHRLFRGSVALRQPYILLRKFSGIVEPFIQYERDPLLQDSDRFLQLNRHELGVTSTVFYRFLPFRTVSLQYTFSRTYQLTEQNLNGDGDLRDSFNKSILTWSGTFGRVNNYINPRKGFLVRPFVETAGRFGSGIAYYKLGGEVIGYIPITRTISIGTRLSGGRLWTTGISAGKVSLRRFPNDTETVLFDKLFAQPNEDRFDPIRFYAGGASDVRGWQLGLVGPKLNRTAFVRDDEGNIVFDKGLPQTTNEIYEAIGGLARLSGNIEGRFPIPRLPNTWRAAAFLDFGQVSAAETSSQDCQETPYYDELGRTIAVQCGYTDRGRLSLKSFKFGTGAGIRYETPVGYIRLDLAYKINPDDLDLMTPRTAFLYENGFVEKETSGFFRRFDFHLSLGQAF